MVDRLEVEIAEWRAFVERSPAVDAQDVEDLENHLRDQIADLDAAGLTADEAFLIAVKRIGNLDEVAREFAREHSGRLWKQLVLSGDDDGTRPANGMATAVGFAVAAAATVQFARLAAGFPGEEAWWLARNAALLVLPFLAAYFGVRRGLTARQWTLAGVPVVLAAAVINLYPSNPESATGVLAATHLAVVLWFVVAYPYMGGIVRSHEARMDFVRFTGEWSIYYVLIALGGGVLMGLTTAILAPAGVDAERVIEVVAPLGAAGGVIVAAWLVESKQRVVENMAPVLTMVFTPLFAVMLIVAAVVYAATGLGGAFDRELLAVFDLMMVLVLGLVLYGDLRPRTVPGAWVDGPHPARRGHRRAHARPDGARRDGRAHPRPRVHPEPDGRPRAQPPPRREPRRSRLAVGPVPPRPQHLPPARAVADRATCPSSPCGRPWSCSSSRRSSPSPEDASTCGDGVWGRGDLDVTHALWCYVPHSSRYEGREEPAWRSRRS